MSEFITRVGGNEYQVIFKTNSNENYHAVEDFCVRCTPAVPAVPLDKLCEWLAKYIGFPCNYSPIDEEMADYCGDQCEMDDIGCWKKVLSNWMEGLDDHR
jgi:hypothetical protein